MKKTTYLLSVLLIISSCQQAENNAYESSTEKAPVQNKEESQHYEEVIFSPSTHAIMTDTSKKFIRTGSIKFKCNNVLMTTQKIEDYVLEAEGYVAHTNLTTSKNYQETVQINKDTLIETISYSTENSMTLRIPNILLDKTLRLIAQEISLLDHRNLTAEDISIQLKAEALKQKRLKNYQKRQQKNIDNTNQDLEHKTYAEDELLNKAMEEDQALLEELKLKDKITYSTLHITIYGSPETTKNIITLPATPTPYHNPFGEELEESFQTGLNLLKKFVKLLTSIWPLVLLVGIGLWVYKRKIFKNRN